MRLIIAGRPHDPVNSGQHPFKAGDLTLELFSARRSNPVNPHFPVVRGDAPCGIHPTLAEKPLQSGIERTFLNLEQIIGGVADLLSDSVTMQAAAAENVEHHHFECAGEEIASFVAHKSP